MPAVNQTGIFLFLLIFSLGLRHGFDLDHIISLSDIANTLENKRRIFLLGLLYILGHAFVVGILGLLAVLLGVHLPHWIDSVMEKFVGLTLIILGVWLLFTLFSAPEKITFKSSRLFAFGLLLKTVDWARNTFFHHHCHYHLPNATDNKTAFTIGMIHGIGAETPSQLLLFATAAGTRQLITGVIMVTAFLAGLIIANCLIMVLTTTGFNIVNTNNRLKMVVGYTVALFSIIVGATLTTSGKLLF